MINRKRRYKDKLNYALSSLERSQKWLMEFEEREKEKSLQKRRALPKF